MDRQTVSTEDYQKLKAENERYKCFIDSIDKPVKSLEDSYTRFKAKAAMNIAQWVLYYVAVGYMLIDLAANFLS